MVTVGLFTIPRRITTRTPKTSYTNQFTSLGALILSYLSVLYMCLLLPSLD
jgi:hypothetical protein